MITSADSSARVELFLRTLQQGVRLIAMEQGC